jgi:hypothetical protein
MVLVYFRVRALIMSATTDKVIRLKQQALSIRSDLIDRIRVHGDSVLSFL